MKAKAIAILTAAVLMGVLSKPALSLTLTTFDSQVVFSGTSPSQLAALDAAVGITGFAIEDFEDLTLIPGLTVSPLTFAGYTQN